MQKQKTDAVPLADSTVLERHLPAIRAELDQQRRFRAEQLDELVGDTAEAVATGDEPRLQVARVLRLAAESAMGEIDAALRRLENGSFGMCERCTGPIPFERLEVLPMSRFCTPCQYLVESGRSSTSQRSNTVSVGRIR